MSIGSKKRSGHLSLRRLARAASLAPFEALQIGGGNAPVFYRFGFPNRVREPAPPCPDSDADLGAAKPLGDLSGAQHFFLRHPGKVNRRQKVPSSSMPYRLLIERDVT